MVGLAAPSVLDVPNEELVLRIRGSSRHGQIVRLKSGKCTIGSGPRCTLRLRARGVQPLHCLILRGAAGTAIRRWAPDTRLNGRAFNDAQLVPGDRLAVGPLEFEVLDSSQTHNRAPARPPQTPDRQPPPRPSGQEELEKLTAKLASASRQGRDRVRRLVAQLRSARQEIARLERLQQQEAGPAEAPQPEAPQPEDLKCRIDELNNRETELESRAARLNHQEKTLQQQQESVRNQEAALGERASQVDRTRAELDQKQHELQDQRDRAQEELNTQTEELNNRRAELDKKHYEFQEQRDRWQAERSEAQRELDKRRDLFHQEHRQWADERDRAQEDLHARTEELHRRQAELDQKERELHEQRDRWQAESPGARDDLDEPSERSDAQPEQPDVHHDEAHAGEPEIDAGSPRLEADRPAEVVRAEEPFAESDQQQEIEFDEASAEPPLTTEEVFRRLGMAPSSHDEEPDPQPPSTPEPTRTEAPAKPAPVTDSDPKDDTNDTDDESESIDDYMARLLQRVRETSASDSQSRPADPPPQQETASRSDPPPAPEPADPPPRPPSPHPEPPEPDRISPRAVAPEKSVDLNAMRELANFSAHSAIHRHARRRLSGAVTSKLLMTVAAVAMSAALAWLWWSKTRADITLYAAAASLLIALFWAVQYAALTGRMIFTKPKKPKRVSRHEEKPAGGTPQAPGSEPPTADSAEQPPSAEQRKSQ